MKSDWLAETRTTAFIVLGSIPVWLIGFKIQGWIGPSSHYASGIALIFLPAGLRVVMLMVGGVWAAIGITAANLLLVSGEFGSASFAQLATIAVVGGFAPYVSLRATMILLKIDDNLKKLTASNLPTISVGTAIGSSLLHNVAFCLIGVHLWKDIVTNTSAMALGDFIGTLVVLLVAWGGLALYRRIERKLR